MRVYLRVYSKGQTPNYKLKAKQLSKNRFEELEKHVLLTSATSKIKHAFLFGVRSTTNVRSTKGNKAKIKTNTKRPSRLIIIFPFCC